MSQQQFSYFDPEQETVYEPRLVNRDPRELPEYQEEHAETVYYVTPEQSMLRGEKLIPTQRKTSHANWIATTIFLLMLLFGGFLWAHEVLPSDPAPYPYSSGYHIVVPSDRDGPFFDRYPHRPHFQYWQGPFSGPDSR